jgi:hypothetical protein
MLEARIRRRVPSAMSLGVAELRGHRLRWHKVGRDGSGKCDMVPSTDAGAVVFGVLYEIPTAEKPALDEAEGLGSGYAERRILVAVDGMEAEAAAYFATLTDSALRPYSWYKALVVAGARQHALPPEYVASLESVVAIADANESRHSEHMALAGAGWR